MMKQINDLFDYENLKIVQDDAYFKFSIDSILLAEYVKIKKSDQNIIDLCAGNLPISFILSTKYDRYYHAIELQKEIYNSGLQSLKINKLENKINYIHDDIKNIFNYFNKETFDIVTCYPPYFKNNLENANKIKSIARHEIKTNLEEIISIASLLLKNNKSFYLVHIPTRLDEIFILCHKYNLGIKEIIFINTTKKEPILVLIKAVKNAKLGLKIKYIHDINNLKSYKNLFGGTK